MHLAEINEVIKASPAIQIQSKITHLTTACVECVTRKRLRRTTEYRTSIVSVLIELAKSLGFDSHNEDYLKETLESLVDCTVEWNILGKDKKQRMGGCRTVGICRRSQTGSVLMVSRHIYATNCTTLVFIRS